MDGASGVSSPSATSQVMSALQLFALKNANEAQAAVVELLQTVALPPSPAHLGNRLDVSV
jgi:hypothetical protein